MSKRSNASELGRESNKRMALLMSAEEERAQAALDRLDFKTAEELCTEALANNPLNKDSFLLIRSAAAGRRGNLQASLEDASNVEDEDRQHLRLSYASLRLAAHHMQLAQNRKEEQGLRSSIRDSRLRETILSMKAILGRELKNPFDRISIELFVKILSLCSAPALSTACGVSRDWRTFIMIDHWDLFRVFRMSGEEFNIIEGLELFNLRSRNSLKTIELEFKDMPKDRARHSKDLEESLLPSFSTIQTLSITYRGELGSAVASLAAKCPNLISLRCINSTDSCGTGSYGDYYEFTDSWNQNLQFLEWKTPSNKLSLTPNPLQILKNLKQLKLETIMDENVVVAILPLLSHLEHLELKGIFNNEIDEMPIFNLPNLKFLSLDWVPLSEKDAPNESSFFKNLRAPKLQSLLLDSIHPAWLESLEAGPKLVELKFEQLQDEFVDDNRIDDQVKALLGSLRDWKSLATLKIELWDLNSQKRFFIQMMKELTPLSGPSLSGDPKSVILPNLSSLHLGNSTMSSQSDLEDSGNAALAAVCLVSARSAAVQGFSREMILSAANGLTRFDPINTSKVSSTPTLSITSPLTTIQVNTELNGDGESLSWLKEKMSENSHFKITTD